MEVTKTTKVEFNFNPDQLRKLIAASIMMDTGIKVDPKDIKFNVRDGEPGGYGSMGDPSHVYNDPIPASFGGASVTVITKE